MALLDRLKDATKPTNTIEAVPQQAPAPAQDLHHASPKQLAAATQAAGRRDGSEAKSPAYATEPEAISRAYYVEQRGAERRYFDDYKKTALAIRSDDTTINSKREDLTTIRAMLTMAESKGWQEVKVNGTAEFKREAWIEAAARGVTAQGYKASDIDRQEADRRRVEQGRTPGQAAQKQEGNEIRQAGEPTVAATQAPQTPARQAPSNDRQAKTPPAPQQPEVAQTEAQSRKTPAADQASPAPASRSETKPAPNASPSQPEAAPTQADHRKALREATAELSKDGRLMLAAVSEKIDREMNKMNNDGKVEMKAYFATELLKKEKIEGPVVLSPELKRAATAPEPSPAPQQKVAEAQQKVAEPERKPERQPVRQVEPDEPRRTRRR